MYLLGYDIGSSSVKVCLIEASSGKVIASEFSPKKEMKITAINPGWADQNPGDWWTNLKLAHEAVMHESGVHAEDIKGIGITWQMHGLILVDKDQNLLRPSIIWCDSRAVPYGEKAFKEIGIGDFESIETMQFIPGWTDFTLDFGLRLDVMTSIKGLENKNFLFLVLLVWSKPKICFLTGPLR